MPINYYTDRDMHYVLSRRRGLDHIFIFIIIAIHQFTFIYYNT
jgi:hypothetical protein